MMQGFSADEASSFTGMLVRERSGIVRGIGIRKVLTGAALMCVPVAAYVGMRSAGIIFIKLLGAACAVALWGAWMFLKGVFMILAPKSEPGDIADK
jgi:hypothetical protein